MDEFVYPPYVYSENIIRRSDIFPGYPNREDDSKWLPLFHSVDIKYGKMEYTETKQSTSNERLPKGTLLYHGSLGDTFPSMTFNNDIVSFGLDFLLSSWMLSELFVQRLKTTEDHPPYNEWEGYIHVFKAKKDIQYEYMPEDGCVPIDCRMKKSTYKNVPIVHPQVAFHQGFDGDNDLVELGVEMIIPGCQIEDSVEYLGYHKIDIVKLFMHRTESVFKWKPHDAIKSSNPIE